MVSMSEVGKTLSHVQIWTIMTIEVVSDYIYLGITMNFNNRQYLIRSHKKQLDQGRKALFINVGQNFKK